MVFIFKISGKISLRKLQLLFEYFSQFYDVISITCHIIGLSPPDFHSRLHIQNLLLFPASSSYNKCDIYHMFPWRDLYVHLTITVIAFFPACSDFSLIIHVFCGSKYYLTEYVREIKGSYYFSKYQLYKNLMSCTQSNVVLHIVTETMLHRVIGSFFVPCPQFRKQVISTLCTSFYIRSSHT